VSESPPPFFVRLSLAVATFFRLLADAGFASRLQELDRDNAPRLPEPETDVKALEAPTTPNASDTATVRAGEPTGKDRDLSAALQLLSILQREGRLIDFVKQDIAGFPDADVGAAARVVHAGCRKALAQASTLEPIRQDREGSTVTLEAGFDPKSHRLVGNVQGQPPYRGTLRHRGWRLASLTLEEPLAAADLAIIAPAEVEL
jgi:hypothetical protein